MRTGGMVVEVVVVVVVVVVVGVVEAVVFKVVVGTGGFTVDRDSKF